MNAVFLRKYLVLFIVVLLSAYLFSCGGCGKKMAQEAIEKGVEQAMEEAKKEIEKQEQENATQPPDETTSTETKPGSTGKMTDDAYVDITAYTAYLAEQLADGKITVEEYTDKWNAKLKQYGVTEDEYSDYAKTLSDDPARSIKLAEGIQKKLEEYKK